MISVKIHRELMSVVIFSSQHITALYPEYGWSRDRSKELGKRISSKSVTHLDDHAILTIQSVVPNPNVVVVSRYGKGFAPFGDTNNNVGLMYGGCENNVRTMNVIGGCKCSIGHDATMNMHIVYVDINRLRDESWSW